MVFFSELYFVDRVIRIPKQDSHHSSSILVPTEKNQVRFHKITHVDFYIQLTWWPIAFLK